jgi:hypothetical protein
MTVEFLAAAVEELDALPPREIDAMRNALRKLAAVGERLGYPDSSAVQSASATLRELRPRGGRSAFRAFYRRIGDSMVIAAIGSEAKSDPRGFERAVRLAVARLAAEETGHHE